MATRSTIAIQNEDGTVRSVYCHWDGYPEHVGKLLQEHYNGTDQANDLIDLGNISSLDKSIEKPEGHSFEHATDGYTVFYGRDRGETEQEPKTHKTKGDWLKYAEGCGAEFAYIYSWGEWRVIDTWGQTIERALNESEV